MQKTGYVPHYQPIACARVFIEEPREKWFDFEAYQIIHANVACPKRIIAPFWGRKIENEKQEKFASGELSRNGFKNYDYPKNSYEKNNNVKEQRQHHQLPRYREKRKKKNAKIQSKNINNKNPL